VRFAFANAYPGVTVGAMRPRHFFAVLALAVLTVVESQRSARAQTLLFDNFASDASLNADFWTTKSPALNKLADYYSSVLQAPGLNFGPEGMWMTGVIGESEIVGVTSMKAFAPPFTFTTTVNGTIANGNAFAVYLMTPDLKNALVVSGNLNKENAIWYGIRANSTGNGVDDQTFIHLGDNVYAHPSTNTPYVIQLAVDAAGNGTVTVATTQGAILGTDTGLTVGPGPFYAVLAQREGTPNTVGPNVALWTSVKVEKGANVPTLSSRDADYMIETSTDGQHWTLLKQAPGATPAYFEGPETGGKRFYRAIPKGD
jgi:hypothetical protein